MPFDALGSLPSSNAELLSSARAMIRQPHRWVKCKYSDTVRGFEQYCPVQALAIACGNTRRYPSGRHPTWRERQLAKLLVREMPQHGGVWRWMLTSHFRVKLFNDHRTTSHRDVIRLFDRAIARQRSLERQPNLWFAPFVRAN
jgi:hypothetical protein